ncbi:MAG: transcription initiation factor IIB family protein [Candidatus Bathyarchaeia archaeon]
MEYREEFKRCPECGGTVLIRDYEAGELVCEECGFVVSSTSVDYGPEWRAFDLEQRERRTRAGSPITWIIHDKGLSTRIGWRGRDAHGRRLKPRQRAKVYRLRKWHRRSKVSGSTERNLTRALSEITRVAYKLNLPKNVLATASKLYRRAIRRDLIRGRSIETVAAASLYMACRQCEVVRSLEEVAEAANITKKEGGRAYRFLLRRLEADVPLFDHHRYVSKFVNKLSLSGDVEILAKELLDQAIELRLTSGRGPAGIAAACIYIACQLTDETRTQHDVAKEAQITEVTIRNRYKELLNEIEIKVEL